MCTETSRACRSDWLQYWKHCNQSQTAFFCVDQSQGLKSARTDKSTQIKQQDLNGHNGLTVGPVTPTGDNFTLRQLIMPSIIVLALRTYAKVPLVYLESLLVTLNRPQRPTVICWDFFTGPVPVTASATFWGTYLTISSQLKS